MAIKPFNSPTQHVDFLPLFNIIGYFMMFSVYLPYFTNYALNMIINQTPVLEAHYLAIRD